jgi:hypothetical protein
MSNKEDSHDSDDTPSPDEDNGDLSEGEKVSTLSYIFGSEEVAASHYSRLIHELKQGKPGLQDNESEDPIRADDPQRLAIGEDEYDLVLSEKYLRLIKVEGLRSSRLVRRWRKTQNETDECAVQIEWGGRTFQAPLEQFSRIEDVGDGSSPIPEQANAFVKSVSPKEESSEPQEEKAQPGRPSPVLRADGKGGYIEFREGQTREGEVYLYLLRD